MKKMDKIILLLTISLMLVGNVSAATIEKIDAINNSTVELTASNDVVFSDVKVEGDVKILKDILVTFSAKDSLNAKKVIINLSDDLISNASYSLISILGANGNIDFDIGDFLEGEINNANLLADVEGIQKINILDSRTIELYFTNDLSEDLFEFKILSEIETSGLKSEGNNKLQLEISKPLEKSTNYIVMIITLKDVNGNIIKFDEDLNDFVTSDDLTTAIPEEKTVIAATYTEPEKIEVGNVKEVALNTASTPATGAETGILILFTAIASSVFFLRKKFVK